MRYGMWSGVMVAALLAGAMPAAAQGVAAGAAASRTPNVEFEMMTWQEVKAALAAGKTTALVYNGGTEQRGPQNVNGGHTLMGREQVRDIALKLGNAIAAPVLPFSPNRASADLPGTIGLTNEIFQAINEPRASASSSATRSTPRPTATSTSTSSPTTTPRARTPASPTPPRCSTSAATRAGCARNW
jgi:hypothetical protein